MPEITTFADSPVGVFDSGLGGLSVLAHLVELLPCEQYIYLADTLHVPYGSRSSQEICELTLQAVGWLVAKGCKIVVIACNTASAYGLQAVRAQYPHIPIVGLVPAIKPAVLGSQNKRIAVLATPATLHGTLLNQVIAQVAEPQGVQVDKYSLSSLVPWVEAGMPETHQAVGELQGLLERLRNNQVDYLVLGCTHYPFFKAYLHQQWQQATTPMPTAISVASTGNDVPITLNIIDSGQAIAKRVYSLLSQFNLLNFDQQQTQLQFYTTANLAVTKVVAQRLLQQFLPSLQVEFAQVAC